MMYKLRIIDDIGFEVWQDIPGYEGLYQVSTYGRIKSLERYRINGKGVKCLFPEKILKERGCTNGYLQVHLCKDGEARNKLIHRLVASAFIPNPNNLPCINHKSEVKSENQVWNLEWASYEYNNNYGTHNERVAQSLINRSDTSKAVIQYDMWGNLIAMYPSAHEAARKNGFQQSNISYCCNNKAEKAYGYKWAYA